MKNKSENKEFDLVSFGEVMLRLCPPDKEKISHGSVFEKNAGGSELNVAAGAAYLGCRSAIITKLPDNKIGRFIQYKIRYSNVSDDYVLADQSENQRLGMYYYETGAYPRKSSVIYDRANSSMNSITIDEIDPELFEKATLFHISGVSLALRGNIRETGIELIKKFKAAGAAISFDFNYRASLWDEEEARATIVPMLPYVDVLFVSEETSRRMMGKTGTIQEIMKQYTEEYGCKVVLSTQREVISPTKHNFGSIIYCNGKYYEQDAYKNIEIVDRVGSGDAYVGGALFGLLKYQDCQKALEFGNAMGAVKNTINGDLPVCSFDEVESIVKSHNSKGPQSEMNR